MAEKEGRLRKLSDEEKKTMQAKKIGETDASQDTFGGILDKEGMTGIYTDIAKQNKKAEKIEKFLDKIKSFFEGLDGDEREQVGKSMTSVIAPYYDIKKTIEYDNNDVGGGYFDTTTRDVPEKDKARVLKELYDSQYITHGKTGMAGHSKELSKTGGEKKTIIQAYNPEKEDFLESLGLLNQ